MAKKSAPSDCGSDAGSLRESFPPRSVGAEGLSAAGCAQRERRTILRRFERDAQRSGMQRCMLRVVETDRPRRIRKALAGDLRLVDAKRDRHPAKIPELPLC